MQALLIRHGRTPGNDERRYIGRTDESLSENGRAELRLTGQDLRRKMVYVSPLLRARETAEILFPNAAQTVLPGLRETDFGIFERKTADEMAENAEYRAWVDGMCLGPCPGGESRADVTKRAVETFTFIMHYEMEHSGRHKDVFCEEALGEGKDADSEEYLRKSSNADIGKTIVNFTDSDINLAEYTGIEEPVIFITHGGVIMSILEALAVPRRDYYDYYTPNLGGWIAECTEEKGKLVLHDARPVSIHEFLSYNV